LITDIFENKEVSFQTQLIYGLIFLKFEFKLYPNMDIFPSEVDIMPDIILIRVDLPPPDGPEISVTFPFRNL
jgi:hypothetical protein